MWSATAAVPGSQRPPLGDVWAGESSPWSLRASALPSIIFIRLVVAVVVVVEVVAAELLMLLLLLLLMKKKRKKTI